MQSSFKHRFMIRCLFFLILTVNASATAAQELTDEEKYRQEYQTAPSDTARINALRKLGTTFAFNQPDSAIKLTKLALAAAKKAGWTKGIAQCSLNLGVYFQSSTAYDSSLAYTNLALDAATKLNDNNRLALIYINRGTLFTITARYEAALADLMQAIKLSEAEKNKDRLARASISLSQLYMYQENWTAALPWTEKALALQTELGNEQQIGICKLNLGGLYLKLGNQDAAETTLLDAMRIAEDNSDYQNMANTAISLSDVYQEKGNRALAISYLKQAVAVSTQIDNMNLLSTASYNLGNAYFESKDYPRALQSYTAGFESVKGVKEQEYEQLICLEGIAKTHSVSGDYKSAYTALSQAMLLKDSVNQRLQNKKLLELQAQFETEQKDKAIALLNKDKLIQSEEVRRQRELKNIFIAGAVLLLLIAALLWNRSVIKQRSARELAAKNILVEQARQRAEKSEQFKSQFLANMSHEIRTPMNAVMGMTNLMLDEPQSKTNSHYLSVIKHASENLLVIINDILDLSKLEAGMMVAEKIPFALQEVVTSIRDTLQLKADEKGLLFITDIAAHIPPVMIGDPSRLSQVLLNLAGNAIKFTETGSITIAIEAIEKKNEQALPENEIHLRFSVSDTGIGIEKEKLSKIFESFTQANTSDTRKFGGTGLGLTISKSLVELLGGKLEVESEPGAGSVFSFILPMKTGTPEQLISFQQRHEGYSADDLFGLRILLVEDNEHNQMVAVDTLKKIIPEVEIEVVNNGKSAIELLRKVQPDDAAKAGSRSSFDLILMDIQMPEMNGYETTRLIRSAFLPPVSQVPIIALTASVIRSDLQKCLEAGMNSYVAKPFRKEELLKEIGKVLQLDARKFTAIDKKPSHEKKEVSGEPSAPVHSAAGNIDLARIRVLYGNDPVKLEEYFRQFLSLVPERIQQLKSLAAAQDHAGIYQAAHQLKPQLSFFGMRKEVLIAHDIETKVTALLPQELATLITELEEGCKLAVSNVEKELQRII